MYQKVWKNDPSQQTGVLTVALVDIEGVVEYKSLPSGLHTVEQDLMYVIPSGEVRRSG